MKKKLIIIIVVLLCRSTISTQILGCGWDPYESYSYHLFNPHFIEAEGYGPFIKEQLYGSWESYHDKPIYKKNIELWKKLLPGWSSKNIEDALTSKSNDVFEKIWEGKKDGLGNQVYKYMVYARTCSDQHKVRVRYSWSYDDVVEDKEPDLTSFIEEGYKYFLTETNQQLKIRYAYQLIRNYHYSKRYQEAIDFYKDKVENLFPKNEMYYYVMDQVAGCYYSLEDYDKAAYLFLQVYSHSYDRKVSSYTSYKFCTDRGGEGKQYFKTDDDKATYITLKAIRGYSGSANYLKQMSEVAPQSGKMELLFVRSLYNIEDAVFPRAIGMSDNHLLCQSSDSLLSGNIDRMIEISNMEQGKCKVDRQDFWHLCSSYLYFLKADFSKATLQLNAINGYGKYAQLGDQLKLVYQVFAWEKLGAKEQAALASILKNTTLTEENKGLIEDYAGHLLYQQGNLAQAFLMHNSYLDVKNMGSLVLLQKMKEFIQKPSHTPLEQWLLDKGVVDYNSGLNSVEFMDYQMGVYYLNLGDPKTAYSYLSNIPEKATHKENGQVASAKVFSNNIKQCFDCSDSLMEDSVYLASVFNFIPKEMSKRQLTSVLIKLDSLATTSNVKQWKRKLAFYLLGNYYFNVSNTGYYRGVLKDRSNCCHYWYVGGDDYIQKRNEEMQQHNGYNLCNVAYAKKTYYRLADKAYEYYRNTIDFSTDKELNARCLYMMAKCELNDMYNNHEEYEYRRYDGNLNGVAANYKKSFKELMDEYDDTKFFDRIIKECSFFRYYCTQ